MYWRMREQQTALQQRIRSLEDERQAITGGPKALAIPDHEAGLLTESR